MVRRKTHGEFVAEVSSKLGNSYQILSEYKTAHEKVMVRHSVCGLSYSTSASNLSRGRKCPKCYPKGKARKTPMEFTNEVIELVGEEYEFLEEYSKSNELIKVIHRRCGNIYEVSPNSFLRGRRCPKCSGNQATQKTTAQFKKEVRTLVGDEYTILGGYVNRATNIEIRHNRCGRVYHVEPGNFLYGSRCIECHYNDVRTPIAEVHAKVRNALGDAYRVEDDYINMQKPLKIRHLECGEVFSVRLTDVVQKRSGCPNCNQSRGEDYVSSYLKARSIHYTTQKRFKDLRNVMPLSYDFYLPDYNVLIEYQGEQHFRPKTFGGMAKEEAIRRLERQKYHDKLKLEYAESNGYVLLTPTYKLNTYEKVIDYLEENLILLEVMQGASPQEEAII